MKQGNSLFVEKLEKTFS